MKLFLIAALLFGATLGAMVYVLGVVIAAVLVLPKVRRVDQPVVPWALACAALPLVTYGVVAYKVD